MTEEMKHKRHWSFVVTDKKYLYPIVAILSVISLIIAVCNTDPSFFPRIGNFVIGIGVWMSLRYTLREGINKHKDLSKNTPTLPAQGKYSQLNIAFFNEIAYSIGDAQLQLHGFALVIYGSLVGSFGDYFVKAILSIY